MQRVLIVNHKKQKCGVYQFGKLTYETLLASKEFLFSYIEVESLEEFRQKLYFENPDVVLYNWHDQTIPWLTEEVVRNLGIPQILITGHDCLATGQLFPSASGFIYPDPTFEEDSKNKKVGRLILPYEHKSLPPKRFTISSFGFGFYSKGFFQLMARINEEVPHAYVKLHIPFSDFADSHGGNAKFIAAECRNILNKDIPLQVTHDFMTIPELIDWLANSTINVFPYDEQKGRGVSSTIDFALAARRPIGITKSHMFRHIYNEKKILLEENSLLDIVWAGTEPLQRFYDRWTPQTLIWDYEKAIKALIL
jgi:hypothetical protein